MVRDLIDLYPDNFAVVEYHVYDEYETIWGLDRAEQFYDWLPGGVPWFSYDGVGNVGSHEVYETALLTQLNRPTSMTLSVGAKPIGNDEYEVTIRGCMEPGFEARTVTAYAVAVQVHWPPEISYARNTFRTAASTKDIFVEPDSCNKVMRVITFKPGWDVTDMKLIVWLQDRGSTYPLVVHQAAQTDYPFSPLPKYGDYTNDGEVSLDDFEAFDACFIGPDSVIDSPSICLDAFDVDKDKDLDLVDFARFQQAIGGAT